MSFSDSGNSTIKEIVFAGYGIRVKKSDDWPEYDSYTHLDVKDKWVMVLRKLPSGWSEERKDFSYYHSTFRKKASVARILVPRVLSLFPILKNPRTNSSNFHLARPMKNIHTINHDHSESGEFHLPSSAKGLQKDLRSPFHRRPSNGIPLEEVRS